MAFFLLTCSIFNFWFVGTSFIRIKNTSSDASGLPYDLLTYAVFAMALLDIPWVFLCLIQCWNNMLLEANNFNQGTGEDSFGCRFMGWYSSFSLIAMMGSHCLVAYYLLRFVENTANVASFRSPFLGTVKGFGTVSSTIFITAILFAFYPLLDNGYLLTNGGFCYADFTNSSQSMVILVIVICFLALSTSLWHQISTRAAGFWYFYAFFFLTWFLWIPASIYGTATGLQMPYPYFIIGGVIGHGNALVNPVLYGVILFRRLEKDFLFKSEPTLEP